MNARWEQEQWEQRLAWILLRCSTGFAVIKHDRKKGKGALRMERHLRVKRKELYTGKNEKRTIYLSDFSYISYIILNSSFFYVVNPVRALYS